MPGRLGVDRDVVSGLEPQIALDAEAERALEGLELAEAYRAQLRCAEAEIGQAMMDVRVLGVGVDDEPDTGAGRVEPLDQGNPVCVGVPAIGEQLLAEFGGDEFP